MNESETMKDIIAYYLANNEPDDEIILRLEQLSKETMNDIEKWAEEYK